MRRLIEEFLFNLTIAMFATMCLGLLGLRFEPGAEVGIMMVLSGALWILGAFTVKIVYFASAIVVGIVNHLIRKETT